MLLEGLSVIERMLSYNENSLLKYIREAVCCVGNLPMSIWNGSVRQDIRCQHFRVLYTSLVAVPMHPVNIVKRVEKVGDGAFACA